MLVFKIVLLIKDVIVKNRIKTYLNRAKRKIDNFDFELIKEFEDNRQAVNFLYQNEDIDILILENSTGEAFAGLDFVMLAENEFPKSSIILLTENGEKLDLKYSNVDNLTSILNKNENYISFINKFKLTLLKQQRKNKAVRKEKQKLNDYRTIIDHTHDAIFLVEVDCDENFYYKRINGTHQRLTALSNEEIQGKTAFEIFDKEVAEELENNYRKCLKKKSNINYTETIEFPAGKKSWQTSLYPVVRNGRVEEIVGASYDITEMEEKQKKLNYIKRHDRLTGLYNKDYFNKLFSNLNKNEDIDLSLILVNVENFHLINKFFSYQKGNQILKEIGSILAKHSSEDKIAAHLCADHFAVIFKNESRKALAKNLRLIKKDLNELNIHGIYLDVTAVSLYKLNKNLDSNDFFNDAVSKINFKKFKSTAESRFYQSLMEFLDDNNYKALRHDSNLVELAEKTANYFELEPAAKDSFLLLARHHDIGKLALNKNIAKKGSYLTEIEWHEYKKHVVISADFAAYYYDLNRICKLIYHHHEHFDGSGWPEGLAGKEIPYLARLFSIVNFYNNIRTNIFFPFLENKYYFGALDKKEAIEELKFYQGSIFDPILVDNFIGFLES